MDQTLERRQEFEKLHLDWGQYNIYQEFFNMAERFPDYKFLIDDDGSISYREAVCFAEKIADCFRAKGIKKDSHVALCVDKKRWFVLISLALYRIGAVKIPTTQKLGKKELLYVLNQSDSEYVISQHAFSKDFLSETKKIKAAFALQLDEEAEETIDLSNILNMVLSSTRVKEFSYNRENAKMTSLEDVVDIMYTSGSTSMPKGVMLTNQMLLQSAYANNCNRGFTPGRRIYIPIPLHHVFGYVEGVLAAILSGGTMVFTDGKFDVRKSLKCMEDHKVQDILAVPSMLVKMVRSPEFEEADLSSLYAMYCGASICSETVWQELQDRFGIKEIVTGYGMTELAGATMQNLPGDGVAILKRSLGKLLTYRHMNGEKHWIEYKVVDPATHEPTAPGEIGELLCRGALVTPGYYNDPKTNEKTFTKDGWLITGDIAGFDENGYIEFVGRSKDQCKVNGENVSLKFLDETIGECPVVQAVETVAVMDAKSGNAVVAFVESQDDTPKIKEEIIKFSRQNLTSYQMPRYFVFGKREEWPQTSSLKIQKNQLHLRAELLLAEAGEKYKAESYLNPAAEIVHNITHEANRYYIIEPITFKSGWKSYIAKSVKDAVSIPVIATNVIKRPQEAEDFLAQGIMDFAAVARGNMADENWAKKAREGRPEEIRPCIGCLHCLDETAVYRKSECAVNARMAREDEFTVPEKNMTGKNIVVVGAGPAGMEAAMVLKQRGAQVVVYEKNDFVGGAVALGGRTVDKEPMTWLAEYYSTMAHKMGIPVYLSNPATPELIAAWNPYAVFLATGAKPIVPKMPGLDSENVYTVENVLTHNMSWENKKIVVIGGGMTGCEVAEKYSMGRGKPLCLYGASGRVNHAQVDK